MNRLVPPVPPFTLLPVILEVVHLVALVVELVLSEGVLETALSALADEEEDEQGQQDRPGGGSANVDTGFGACRQVVPFVAERLWWRLVDLLERSGVTS